MTFREVDPDLVSREEAAAIAGFSVSKLDYMTSLGRTPIPFRYNPRCIMYLRREMEAYRAELDAEDRVAAAAKEAKAATRKPRRAKMSA